MTDRPASIRELQGDHRWLSNFWPAELRVELFGVRGVWPSSENLYQAAKLFYTDLPDSEQRELAAELLVATPGKAKKIGAELQTNGLWEEQKIPVMRAILAIKFQTNEDLYHRLADLDGVLIEEGNSWGDRFWGVDGESREGQNHLGKILMELASELSQERSAFDGTPGFASFWEGGRLDFWSDFDGYFEELNPRKRRPNFRKIDKDKVEGSGGLLGYLLKPRAKKVKGTKRKKGRK